VVSQKRRKKKGEKDKKGSRAEGVRVQKGSGTEYLLYGVGIL